ncbi:translation initiation factor IF-3 [Ruminococcus sp. YE71]|nr:translation initiation factor IF-3 [Ruminococcus sp. YE78]SFW23880.1 translation initiation factor IF-3 [Ruminococcus sp. YE71]
MRTRKFILCPFILFWRCTVINNKDYKINEDIRDKEVRVVGSDGSQLGIMSAKDALEKAYSEDKDLVKIAPNANPPVCKIMDFGKFLFEQSKREKEAKKNQKVMDVKEVRLSPTIDTHDFETKVNQAMKFLKNGDRLKVEVRFRKKRTLAHPQFGEELLKKFAECVSEVGVVDKQPKMEGRSYVMFVSPKSTK